MHILTKYIAIGLTTLSISSPIRFSRIQQVMDEHLAIYKQELSQTREELENVAEVQEYLEEDTIIAAEPCYNPYNLRESSNLTEDQIYKILEGNSLQTLSRAYYYVEQEYGINALFLIALNREESGNGRSSLAISNNNLGGITSKNGGYAWFENWGESLEYIAELLNNEYLSEDGAFYNGCSVWDVNIRYCEQNTWGDKINNIAYEMMDKLK